MIIYSQQMCAKLMLRGFILQGIDKHKNKTGRNIFYFNDSKELNNAVKELTKIK